MARNKRATQPGSLRIIGGDWRGRRLPVADAPGLRPTPDRVRETLFNWLAPQLPGSRCLDVFAGTGALGLEALSRGAGEVVFVENNPALATGIEHALTELGAAGGRVTRGQAPAALHALEGRFDIVFLDPPFNTRLMQPTLAGLPPLLAPDNHLYLEYPAAQTLPEMPGGWQVLRDKTAGDVGYRLASWSLAGETREA